MKRIFLSLPVLTFLFSCSDPKKEFAEFDSLFYKLPLPIFFESDSVINTKYLYHFEAGDLTYKRMLHPLIIENGGYAFGKYENRVDYEQCMVYIALAEGDGLTPVVFSISPEGDIIDHIELYEAPGEDEGYKRKEWIIIDKYGEIHFKEWTTTWESDENGDPIDSTLKTVFSEKLKSIKVK